MRFLVAVSLLSLVFAGCMAPEEEKANPLFGVCPQWIEGEQEVTEFLILDGSEQTTLWPVDDDGLDAYQGFALDRYTLQFTNVSLDGQVELRAFAHGAERRLAFTDYQDPDGPHLLPFAKLDDQRHIELDVFLTAVAHGTAPAPDALRLAWSGDGTGTVEYTVRASYRVCGAPV